MVPFRGSVPRPRMRYARPFRVGYDRTGGYYGRFSGTNPGGSELKFHDIAVDDAVIAQAGTIQNGGSICLIGQATTESTRIGRKCTVKAIQWKINLQRIANSSSTTPSPETVRMMMYLDKQANGATVAALDILETDSFQSFRNLANTSRFRILFDRTYTFNETAGAGNGTANDWPATAKNLTFYKRCNIPLEFSGVANPSVITELRSNNIGVICWSQNGDVSAMVSSVRLRFSDN